MKIDEQVAGLVRAAFDCGYALGSSGDVDQGGDLRQRYDAAILSLEDARRQGEKRELIEAGFMENSFVDAANVGLARIHTAFTRGTQSWRRSVLLQWRYNGRDELFGFLLDEQHCDADARKLLEIAQSARERFAGQG